MVGAWGQVGLGGAPEGFEPLTPGSEVQWTETGAYFTSLDDRQILLDAKVLPCMCVLYHRSCRQDCRPPAVAALHFQFGVMLGRGGLETGTKWPLVGQLSR
jgi:hypothetical protein